ncbi:MAG: hypothetical protein ACYSN9_08580 [Planctomycetota bacterium]|jgi:hypothetical protein
MGHWQSKFLFSVILYAAGFVTAVYFLAPHPASAADQGQATETSSWLQPAQAVAANSGTDSEVWMTKIRAGIDTSIDFAEEQALRVANLIRSKMKQGDHDS